MQQKKTFMRRVMKILHFFILGYENTAHTAVRNTVIRCSISLSVLVAICSREVRGINWW